jgi:glycosyltransferase involved in cell wall biosynthesis
MKKVLIVSGMKMDDNSAASKRVKSFTLALSPKVDEVYVVSFYSVIKNEKIQFNNSNNNIFRSVEYPISMGRSVKLIKKNISLLNDFLKHNSEAKIIIYPTMFFIYDIVLIVNLLIKKKGFYIELNEVKKYCLHSFKTKNGFIKKTFSSFVYTLMDLLYKTAVGHLYISSTIAKYYKKKNSIVITILCNTKNLTLQKFKKYSESETFYIGFAGTIDPAKEKMTSFFESIRNISYKYPKIKINLYGEIPNENEFLSKLNEYDIKDVFHYKGMIKHNLLIEKLKKENHLLILPRGNTKQNYYGFSTKLTDYLEAQTPILTSTVGDIGKYFVEMKNSFNYTPDDVESLTKKIEFIIKNYNDIAPSIIKGGDNLVNDVLHFSNYSNALNSYFYKNKTPELDKFSFMEKCSI